VDDRDAARMTARFDLLVVGDANPDVVFHGAPRDLAYGQAEQLAESGALTVGGSAAITACAAARLGLRTALVSVVGDDAGGRFIFDELERRGVDTAGIARGAGWRTGLTVALARHEDRAIVTSPGCIDELHAGLVDAALLGAARHVHVGSFFLQPRLAAGLAGLFAEAHAAGATTSLDLNWDPSGRWDGGLADVLPAVDVLFVNASEAAVVSGAADPAVAATVLGAQGPLPVVKLGAAGALTHDGCRLVSVSAPAVDVADTVGAGDSFDAGFICGRLMGWEVGRCLALGAAVGSLSARAAGGVDAQPTRDEASALIGGLVPDPPASDATQAAGGSRTSAAPGFGECRP
jgi:sugar/nucleoside kinase (ribokinase family)